MGIRTPDVSTRRVGTTASGAIYDDEGRVVVAICFRAQLRGVRDDALSAPKVWSRTPEMFVSYTETAG